MPRRTPPAAAHPGTATAAGSVGSRPPRVVWPVRVYTALLVVITVIAVGVAARQWMVADTLARSAQAWQNEQVAWTQTTRDYQASYQAAVTANRRLVVSYNRLLADRKTLVRQYATALARAGRQDHAAAATATSSAPAAAVGYASVPAAAPTTRVS
jgi:hypothetical protein